MSKQEYPIEDFSGGLNNAFNARDIADNELVQADDIIITERGKLKMMGGLTDLSFTIADIDDMDKGYGLFRFNSDYALSGKTSKNFIAIAGYEATTDDFICVIYDSDGNAYGTKIELNATENSGFVPVFYYIDGGLRICDGGFNTNSTDKWFGYVDRDHFKVSGTAINSYNAWYIKDTELAAPTTGLVIEYDYGNDAFITDDGTGDTDECVTTIANLLDDVEDELDTGNYDLLNADDNTVDNIDAYTSGSDTIDTDATTGSFNADSNIYVLPNPGTGIVVWAEEITTAIPNPFSDTIETSNTAGTLEFACSFVYDNEQESLLKEMDGTLTIAAGSYMYFNFHLYGEYNQRISHIRFYGRYGDSNDWVLLSEIDMLKGARPSLDSNDYTAFTQIDATATAQAFSTGNYVYDIGADTYESINGFSPEKDTLTASYNTAVVANRMAYIGNVKYNGVTYEDAIFKSYPNRFDTFTLDRRIEIVRGDGESIIKLEEYADRLLVFKEDTMFLLNVSQEVEFLEDTFHFHGISKPYQSFRTEFGIAWANEYGCYLYNGQSVIDLLLDRADPTRRKISLSSWQTFVTTGTSVGYDPIRKLIIIVSDITSATDQNIMVYDMVVGSWTKGIVKFNNDTAKYSNFDVDWDGNLIVYDNTGATLYKWDNAAKASGNLDVRFKDIVFGSYVRDKRFYGINVTHKGAGSSTSTVTYGTNGGTTIGTAFSTAALDNNTNYAVQEFRVSSVPNCKSAQVKISAVTTIASTFEVDDIALIHRVKGVR